MAETAPQIIPSPPVLNPEEMTLEALMRGVQLANLANPAKIPESVYRPKERGPGSEERPVGAQMMRFRISSRAVEHQWWTFLSQVGWHGLWAPKELIPADTLLDSFYTNHAMVYAPGEITSEYQIRTKAREIVLKAEGLYEDYSAAKIKLRRFTIESPVQKTVYQFYTHYNWRGLKAPRRVVPGANRGNVSLRYLDVFSPDELEGKSKIRKAALELVKAHENAMIAPRKDKPGHKNITICLSGEHLAKWNALRAFLGYVDLPETQSAAARWMLEKIAPLIPKQEEWEAIRKQVHADQKRARKKES